jgi:hypothetical protein
MFGTLLHSLESNVLILGEVGVFCREMKKSGRWIPGGPTIHRGDARITLCVGAFQDAMFAKLFEGFANGGLAIGAKMGTNGANCTPVAAKIENGTN